MMKKKIFLTQKSLSFILDKDFKKARAFVPGKIFQPSHIMPICKSFPGTNTRACSTSMTKKLRLFNLNGLAPTNALAYSGS
jgi:hypothetical protein